MATQVFAGEELERLRGFPEIGREELFRFFTLAPADVAFVDPGRGRGPADRLGLSVALCTLPWLGFVPDDVAAAPPVAVARLADQLAVDPGVLRHYGRRAKTRTEHLRLVAQYRGWRVPTSLEFKEFDEFLLARAMEHDSPTLLFRLACEYLISVQVIRPGPVTVLERVAHARAEAQRETYDRLAHEFTEQRCAGLDALLVVDSAIGMTRLRWLTTVPVEASPAGIKAEVTKLEFLRGLGADALDLSVLPAERRRFLATVGRRLTAQALDRREPQRRDPILLTLLAQSATDVLDEVVSLFDQAVSAREGKAERTMRNALAERGKAGEDRQALLDELLAVIADTTIADEDIGSVIRGERIGWARIRAAMAQAVPRLPRDHGHLGALDVSSYGYLRQFTPQVLAAVEFAGGTAASELLAAVKILRALNATGARRVPAGAPTGFVPTRWRGYLDTAHAAGNTSAYRHFWELCTLLGLRDGLRTGDVYVPGSRRYADPAAYLLTTDAWSTHRAPFCQLVGKSADPAVALAAVADELAGALGALEQVLATGDGPVRLDDAGELVISPLTAEDIPAEAVALKAELTDMLPFAPIVSLLIELDGRIGLLDCFTHAGGKQTRSPELKRNLIAVLLSHSTNLGLTRMADACGISYDILAWTAEWYVHEETLRAANLTIIDHHQRMPLAEVFGTGTLSSSDGQRFPVRGKTTTGREMTIHGGQVLSTYTHVTDQHTTYGTKIIVATKREAHYVLDEILGNTTDIPITEHATDTHGVTLVNFGLFDLLGLQLSPRIRDLGKITLHRIAAKTRAETDYPHVGPLLTRRVNVELIAEHWDDLLRLAGSLKFGHSRGPRTVPPGVEYHRVLAGEKRRIGRGILAIALLLGGMAAFAAVLVGGAAAIDAQLGNTSPALGGTDYTPLYHAAALASVALVTPWSMLIQRWLYGVRGASLHSVVSRFRPDLLGRGLLLVGPFWVLAYVVQNLAVGPGALTEMSFATVIGLLAVTLLLAPLQAGAEEYGLRGLVFRVAGSWARGPQAGLILGIVVSSVVFAVIHGATDPWLNIYYLTFSVAVAVITWRTGGIEIAVVVHAVTNMLSFSFAIAVRQDLAGSLANRAPGDVAAAQVLPSMIALALVMAVVWLRTRRTGPARTPSEA